MDTTNKMKLSHSEAEGLKPSRSEADSLKLSHSEAEALKLSRSEAFALGSAVHDRLDYLNTLVPELQNEILLLQILNKKIMATL